MMGTQSQLCQTYDEEFVIIDSNDNCCNNSKSAQNVDSTLDPKGETAIVSSEAKQTNSSGEKKCKSVGTVTMSDEIESRTGTENGRPDLERTEEMSDYEERDLRTDVPMDSKSETTAMCEITLTEVTEPKRSNSHSEGCTSDHPELEKRRGSDSVLFKADKSKTNEHHYSRTNSCGCGIQSKNVGVDGPHICGKEPDDECKAFMENIVDSIFSSSAKVVPDDSVKFDNYCRTSPGRYYFAHLLNDRRVHQQRVSELTFYRLVQFFAICLFECNEAEDFGPATTLMNMCFTFQHIPEGVNNPEEEEENKPSFLYTYLRDQLIWKSLRFWNAAFFTAMHQERSRWKNHFSPRNASREELMMADEVEGNTTFGQLATILHNMRELNIPKKTCLEFLQKISVIGNLSPEQCTMLEEQFEWGKNLLDEKSQSRSNGITRSRTLRKMKTFLVQSVDRKMTIIRKTKTIDELSTHEAVEIARTKDKLADS